MGGIIKSIGKIVKGIVKGVIGVVKSIVNFVGDMFGFVLNPFGAMDTPQVGDPGQQAQGIQVTKQGTTVPVPVIYGFRRVGGVNIFTETNGQSNKYLYVVYALSEGEIHGVGKVLVNDVELPLPSGGVYSAGTIHSVTQKSSRYKDRIQLQFFYGTETQGQSSLAGESASWNKKRRTLPGLAYAVMRFEWKEIKTQEDADNNPFSGGIPQVKFDVFGKKVYDVRTHTAGNLDLSGSYASRSKSYSFNPANCLLDYLENPRYGAGMAASEINAESFRIAANKYEQIVNYSATQTGRAMTMNAVVDTGQKILDNVKILIAGARGIMPFTQGRYKLKVEDGGNATDITSATVNVALDVDKDLIIGGISMEGERKNTKYNQVIVNYIDPDIDFTAQQKVHTVTGDQTIDNDEELTGEFTFQTLTNPSIARDLAEMIYQKSRAQRTVAFQGTQEFLNTEVGDIIRITDPILDLSLQTFRIVGLTLRADGNVNVECIEHDATLYPFVSGDQVEVPPPLYRPDEFTVIPYVRPLPENPLGIVPPFDPDNPGVDPNLPPSFDDPLPAINRFANYSTKVYLKSDPAFTIFPNRAYVAALGGGIADETLYIPGNTPAELSDGNDGGAVPDPRYALDYGVGNAFGDSALAHIPKPTQATVPASRATDLGYGDPWPADYPFLNKVVEAGAPTGRFKQHLDVRYPDVYYWDRQKLPILGYARRLPVGGFVLHLVPPDDVIINELVIQRINPQNGSLLGETIYPIRDPNFGGQFRQINIITRNYDNFHWLSGVALPKEIVFVPQSPNDFLRVLWRKNTGNLKMDYADGSKLYEFEQEIGAPYAYGTGSYRRSGSNLEAFINYLNYIAYNTAITSGNSSYSSQTTAINLGG